MTTKNSYLIQSFFNTLVRDFKAYQKLEVLLKQQKLLYLSFDAEKLEQNLTLQQSLLSQLQQHAQKRSQIMVSLQLSADKTGIERFFSALPSAAGKKVRCQWQHLENMVKRCQTLNQENGQTSANFHELMVSVTSAEQHTYQEHLLG
ncbi:flagellar export chaperone FlgN [Vibrio hepatarius]|uniref:flagellar export chaperone FlgN n=1 Tax=Vibrio hepatarius TaxID=171383 RepID=UPI001C09B893|nr:flagellar export chaperone FlgN [Vibrio hepatarius]MBU2898661.1 flagellar protein FlgN [Vibrio hepatarius]